jgi:hypothetical protein
MEKWRFGQLFRIRSPALIMIARLEEVDTVASDKIDDPVFLGETA